MWALMKLSAAEIVALLSNDRLDGDPLPILSGAESDVELHELMARFSQRCPVGRRGPHCPFRLLDGLSWTSLKNLLANMDRKTMLEIFQMELDSRRACLAAAKPRIPYAKHTLL